MLIHVGHKEPKNAILSYVSTLLQFDFYFFWPLFVVVRYYKSTNSSGAHAGHAVNVTLQWVYIYISHFFFC